MTLTWCEANVFSGSILTRYEGSVWRSISVTQSRECITFDCFFFFGRTNKFFRVKIVADFLLFLVKKKIKTYLCNESSFARILLVSVSFVIRIDSFERGRRLFRGTRNRLKSIIYAPRLAWKRGAKGRTGGKRFIFFIRSDGEWWSSSSASIEARSRIRMHSTRERPEKELVQELNDRTRDKTDKNVGDVIGPPQVYYREYIRSVSQPPKLTSTNRSITHPYCSRYNVSLYPSIYHESYTLRCTW